MKKIILLVAIVIVLLVSNSVLVLAATAPAITAEAATYIAQTTAQLNAIVNDDGGEDCDVRWGWDTETRAVFEDYANKSDWDTTGYNTDDHPYTEIDTLNAGDEYFWAVEIKNTHSTVKSSELSFTTEADVAVPTNLVAHSTDTAIELAWTKGTGSSLTVIRYSESTYPTTVTAGTSVYVGVLSNCSLIDLSPGHDYYISAWGRSGLTDSDTYAFVMISTTAGSPAGAEPGVLSVPPAWFRVPDYTSMSNLPLYDQVNALFEAFEVPLNTGWLGLAVVSCMSFGALIFFVSGKKPTPALVALAVAFGAASMTKLLPMFMVAFAAIFMIGAWRLKEAG